MPYHNPASIADVAGSSRSHVALRAGWLMTILWLSACVPAVPEPITNMSTNTPLPPSPTAAAASPTPQDATASVRIEVVEASARFPVAMQFAPDGRLFYLARSSGAVMVNTLERDTDGNFLSSQPVLEGLPLPIGEGDGPLSMALDPDFAETGHFYVYYTDIDAEGVTQRVPIVRYTEVDGHATDETLIVGDIPTRPEQRFHFGGALSFGPDGKLYLIYGDTDQAATASDPDQLGGSILRFNPDGSIPDDNPFAGSPVYSYGHRNGFGLAWHPETGTLYESENGQTCDDELNRIQPGANYGWGSTLPPSTCPYPDNQGVAPLFEWTPNIAPTGMTFYTGDVLPELQGSLLMCAVNTGLIYRIQLSDDGQTVEALSTLQFAGLDYYCGLAIVQGPDGWLYTSTPSAILRIGR